MIRYKDILLVEVPVGDLSICQYSFMWLPDHGIGWLHFMDKDDNDVTSSIQFNEKWEIIGKADCLTEKYWEGIVETHQGCVKDYVTSAKSSNSVTYCHEWTFTKSGHSLLASHGLKPETTLILKLK